jgi:hypothetical protein
LHCEDDLDVMCSPLHRCGAKDCDNTEGGIIGCRRCPIAYHEECLPLAVLVTRNREFGRRVWIATVDEEGNPIMDENGAPRIPELLASPNLALESRIDC